MAKEPSFTETNPRPAGEGGTERWAQWLLNVVDAALAGCIFVLPLLLGGRSALGHFGLAIFAATAACAWWVRQSVLPRQYWRRSAGHLLLLAAIAVVGLQLAPLPATWMSRVSPKSVEILPLWSEGASAGFHSWRQVSLTPSESRDGLVLLLAYALVFWVTVQRIRSMEDVEKLLRWVAYSAIGMGLFGLIQYVTSNGKFFWVYQHPFAATDDGAKGAFTNRNHFAHFLALGIGPVIWWVQDGMRRAGTSIDAGFRTRSVRNRAANLDLGLRFAGLVVVFLAILMSLSRGGAIAAGVAALVSVGVCYRAGAVRGKFALGLTAVALLLGGFLLVGHEESMGGRLEGLASGSVDQIDEGEGRRIIWHATLSAIPDFAWLGSGVGSFREVYPLYLEHRPGYTYYTHAENGYLQVALETGIPGLVLVILAILIGGLWIGRGLTQAKSSRVFVAVGAVAAAILASIVHSGVDFVWYAPGCLVPALILCACACRLSQFTHDEERRRRDRFVLPGPAAWLAAPIALAMGLWMVTTQIGPLTAEPHWTKYERLERASYLNPTTVEVPEEEGFFPEDPRVVAAREEAARKEAATIELERERQMVEELVETVRRDPDNGRAQLALASGYLRLFHFAQERAVNRMPLSSIRDAALAAGYSSQEELEEWLSRAVGQHYVFLKLSLEHAKAAVELCPLQGEGYLCLGELCFLDVHHTAETWDFVEQALRVRPYDGTVLFHAGREAWLAGRVDEGLDYWMKSYSAGPIYQRQVIDWMAGRTVESAVSQEIEFLIEQFRPGLDILKYMQSVYQPIADPGQMTPLLEAVANASQIQARAELEEGHPETAAERWLDAMSAYQQMMRLEDAAVCGRRAVECNSHNFDARYRLGFLLSDMGQYAEADEHLAWCSRVKPGHIKVRRRLTEVKRMLLDPEGAESRRFGTFYPPGTEFTAASLQVAAPKATTGLQPGWNNTTLPPATSSRQQAHSGRYPTYPYSDPKIPMPAGQGATPSTVYRR